ncbi:MAG TPA: DNA gyrase inhibitor YacG [Gammaproteobacteria bacterium]|nr:DNA gyrase inhibitor YacG [Gammaproteobacteria bacterium]
MATNVACPRCRQSVPWNEHSTHRPFCSEKCKLIDLGKWADEDNRISEPLESDLIWDPYRPTED